MLRVSASLKLLVVEISTVSVDPVVVPMSLSVVVIVEIVSVVSVTLVLIDISIVV